MLAGSLLETKYGRTVAQVSNAMTAVTHYCCLTSDGWSNTKNLSVVNLMVINAGVPMVYDTVFFEAKSHSAQTLFESYR